MNIGTTGACSLTFGRNNMKRNNTHKYLWFILCSVILLMGLQGCSKKDPLPVSVTFREAIFDESLVVQFRNTSGKYLVVVVKTVNTTLNQEKEGYVELPPGKLVEGGWAEGWKYVSGEVITIRHDDYATKKVTVP